MWVATVTPQNGLWQTYVFLHSLYNKKMQFKAAILKWLLIPLTTGSGRLTKMPLLPGSNTKIITLDFILLFVLINFAIVNGKYSLTFGKVILAVVIHLNVKRKGTLKEKISCKRNFCRIWFRFLTLFCKSFFLTIFRTSQLKNLFIKTCSFLNFKCS